ncbi:NADPH-dependent FMN reductase [Acinetobacter stercoris]|uniref:FMN-dependent NADPH-azoreductase n=1 Tax=Acinetobacter stercoris TaxID=2126983 RepID=A0A2U3N363_9GAMM|nr:MULTISPECIES: NAD(P)H-dependent oxidoreductase [Acinetobacter]SPL72126.1 FMN-dependent NADPH-azoreductase [Acinetobacter stercoris]
MKIQIIIGSVREGRTAIKVAKWVENTIKNLNFENLELELIDLKEWNLPIFAGSHPPATGVYDQPKQQEWANLISSAQAYILISPEYNHGYSPALKNALDYIYKEWQGKPVAVVSYGGTNGSRSIDQIRQVCSSLGLIISNAEIEIRDIGKRNKEESFQGNEFDTKALKSALEKLIRYAPKN